MFVNWNQLKHSSYGHKFWDDCRAWTESRGRKIAVDPATLSEVRQLLDGLYGMRKRVDDKSVVVPLDSQPSQVYQVLHFCNQLKRDNTYQRCVTYLTQYVMYCYVAEYFGTFPEAVDPYGNSVYATGEYVRSTPEHRLHKGRVQDVVWKGVEDLSDTQAEGRQRPELSAKQETGDTTPTAPLLFIVFVLF